MRQCTFFLFIVFLTSCSSKNELTKEEAFKIIESSYKITPCHTAVTTDIQSLGLSQNDLKKYDFKRNHYGGFSRAIISTGKLQEILGVSIDESNKNEAAVLFKIYYSKNPLSLAKGHTRFDDPYNCSEFREKEKEIKLVKYDTGWRIKK